MVEVLTPNTKIDNIKKPLIFLAGPIKSTPDWRSSAIKTIESYKLPLIIASPAKRIDIDLEKTPIISSSENFERQREWENYYLNIASKEGSILFWFPQETEHNCDKSYAAMTRVEIGQWMTEYKYDKSIRLCIGTDGNFSEFRIIEYDLSVNAPEIKIRKTLEETCQEAINLIKNSRK
jgi:hypothetical protein